MMLDQVEADHYKLGMLPSNRSYTHWDFPPTRVACQLCNTLAHTLLWDTASRS